MADGARALPALLLIAFLLLLALRPVVGRFANAAVSVALLLIFAFTFEAVLGLLPKTSAGVVSTVGAAVLGLVEILLLVGACRALRQTAK